MAESSWTQLIVPGASVQTNPLIPLNGYNVKMDDAEEQGEIVYWLDSQRNAWVVKYLKGNSPGRYNGQDK